MVQKILIMEDDPIQSELLFEALSGNGYEAVVTTSASEALRELEKTRYDLIIADIYVKENGKYVPNGGLLLLGRLRNTTDLSQYAWWRDLPVIVISGAVNLPGQTSIFSTAESLGATRTLGKPFELEQLFSAVEDLIEPSDLEKQNTVL